MFAETLRRVLIVRSCREQYCVSRIPVLVVNSLHNNLVRELGAAERNERHRYKRLERWRQRKRNFTSELVHEFFILWLDG